MLAWSACNPSVPTQVNIIYYCPPSISRVEICRCKFAVHLANKSIMFATMTYWIIIDMSFCQYVTRSTYDDLHCFLRHNFCILYILTQLFTILGPDNPSFHSVWKKWKMTEQVWRWNQKFRITGFTLLMDGSNDRPLTLGSIYRRVKYKKNGWMCCWQRRGRFIVCHLWGSQKGQMTVVSKEWLHLELSAFALSCFQI